MSQRDDMPGRVALLPRNKAGYPVPWFVATIDGAPDFRIIRAGGIQIALRQGLCWVCGVPFRRQEDRAFVIGPMCAVNRVSAEPPAHRDCAVYSATHCPFLATPQMKRRGRHMPAETVEPAGKAILRNPGVALAWVTGYRSWSVFDDGTGGTLFDVGEPREALWFARGRTATRAEVLASIDSGLPILREQAEAQSAHAVAELEAQHAAALGLIPAAAA